MRTNIVIDDDLVEEAKKLTGIKTKRELVRTALLTLIRQSKRKNLLDLKGKIRFARNYDYKEHRKGRS